MPVIILVNVLFELYLSPPWLRNTDRKRERSITPDLSDNVLKKQHSFLIYLVPQYLLFFILNTT